MRIFALCNHHTKKVIGGAVYISGTRQRSHSSTVVVNNNQHDRNVLVIGEANEAIFPRFPGISRVATFQSLFEGGSPNISVEATSNPKETRDAIFQKLVANLSYNVLSALTGASGRVLCTSPDLRRLGVAMIDEAMAVAASLPGEDKIMFPRDALGIIDFIGQRHPPGSRKLPSVCQSTPVSHDACSPFPQYVHQLFLFHFNEEDAARS